MDCLGWLYHDPLFQGSPLAALDMAQMDFFSFLRSPLCLDPLVPLDELVKILRMKILPVDMGFSGGTQKISDPCFALEISALVLRG